jgi:predicted methyltransferase
MPRWRIAPPQPILRQPKTMHKKSTIRWTGLRRGAIASAAALLLLAMTACAATIPPYISAAVADPSRPDTDRQRDADRKPAEVIAFSGIKPGDKVADFLPGKGYFTRIFCKVVGESGRVYAISVPFKRPAQAPPAAVSAGAASNTPAAESPGQACSNVSASTLQAVLHPAPELYSPDGDPGAVYEYFASSPPAENFAAPEPLDLIWTSENYHDLHNKSFGSPDMLAVDQALLKALKPGGILMVEDHAAEAGSGARDTDTLHCIDPEQVKKEVIAAGFVLVGESTVLRHSDDPHTAKAHEMHDKTDRFLLKFRRP